MTANQLKYWELEEAKRSHLANEGLTSRGQDLSYDISSRSLSETQRHNIQDEALGKERNMVTAIGNVARADNLVAAAYGTAAYAQLYPQMSAVSLAGSTLNQVKDVGNAIINWINDDDAVPRTVYIDGKTGHGVGKYFGDGKVNNFQVAEYSGDGKVSKSVSPRAIQDSMAKTGYGLFA